MVQETFVDCWICFGGCLEFACLEFGNDHVG